MIDFKKLLGVKAKPAAVKSAPANPPVVGLLLFDRWLHSFIGHEWWEGDTPQTLRFPDNHRFGYRVFDKVAVLNTIPVKVVYAEIETGEY